MSFNFVFDVVVEFDDSEVVFYNVDIDWYNYIFVKWFFCFIGEYGEDLVVSKSYKVFVKFFKWYL